MKKKIFCLFLALATFLSMSLCAYAADSDPLTVQLQEVVYTLDGSLGDQNAIIKAANTALQQMLPGDTLEFTIPIRNSNTKTTDFYMWNFVENSLENTSTGHGGGYTYKLSYTPGSGSERVIYDSDNVGGNKTSTDGVGLHEATVGLKNWFFIDSFTPGKTGTVKLRISLDGETQGNDYQRALANVKLRFAVEEKGSNNPPPTIVKTGDEYKLVPLYIAMVISGLVFLYLALDSITDRMYGRNRKR